MRTSPSVLLRGATVCALLLALSLDTVHGQELLGSYAGPVVDGQQGRFSAIGDVNGDGVSDHLVGAPGANGQQGLARLLSGADGTLLASLSGEFAGSEFGWSVAAVHDVDGDGVPDFAVGAPATSVPNQGGSVFVHSGATAALLQRLDGTEAGAAFGYALAGLGDIDSDGLADLLISAPFANNATGQVSAFSGISGALLASRSGNQAGDSYGVSLAGTFSSGDGSPEPIIGKTLFSGDGSPEPIIGAALSGDGSPEPIIGASQAGNAGPGYIEILARSDLSLLAAANGAGSGDRFGLAVSPGGDVDADGTLDFIVGASPQAMAGGSSAPGYARVLSGWDGSLLFEFTDGSSGSGFGSAVAGIGDVDGDGYDDVAVGAPLSDGTGGSGSNAGAVRIYGGRDGLLAQLINGSAGSQLGSSVAFAGDIDKDGKADVALGASGDNGGAGRVSVFSLYRWTNIAVGVSGSSGVPVASGSGSTSSNSTVTLSLRNALPLADTVLLVGFGLEFDAAQGTLTPTDDMIVSGLLTDATGGLDYALTLPGSMSPGALIYYQFLVEDPTSAQGTAVSNLVAARGEGS